MLSLSSMLQRTQRRELFPGASLRPKLGVLLGGQLVSSVDQWCANVFNHGPFIYE
jgi:hypothetical protein